MQSDLVEFASKLSKQGSWLRLSLGKSLGVALERFGFRPGQDVLVRLAWERLEIRPRNTPQEIQEKLKTAGEELQQFRERMQTLLGELPAETDDDELEGTLEGELLGCLQCLITDDLEPAIRKLEEAARWQPPPEDEAEPKPPSRRRPPRKPKMRRKPRR
ncbi:MAG TPA: hypothetical protein VGX68_13950 [Thermoanaerobaculia bacterium]|jgi:hypothetical protein|nr:hypothetical protein [Thermoanaerobaculia bacterium]